MAQKGLQGLQESIACYLGGMQHHRYEEINTLLPKDTMHLSLSMQVFHTSQNKGVSNRVASGL